MVIVDGLNFIDQIQPASERTSERASVPQNACAKLNLQNIECFLEQICPPGFGFFFFSLALALALVDMFFVCVYVILFLVRVMPKVNILCSFFSFSVYKRSTCIFIVVVLTLLVACVLISPSQPSAQVGRFENINVCLFFVFCLLLFIYAALFLVDEQDSKTTF